MDSIFNLRRPYDLMAMMRQEEHAVMLNQLKQELLLKKEQIDRNEDRDTGLEERFYREDPDCLAAGKPLLEFDLLISTVLPLENKGIRPEEHLDFNSPPPEFPHEPECTEMIDLDYSIHAFEHLEGMKLRANLSGSPELGLKNAITHRDNVDEYGNLVHEALLKNKTSWVLYNMAAFYWRIKGQPTKVVECLRRALHFSPRMQKDVALISLANILHRAHYSNEAAIVVHAALDVSQELNVNHFTLGNIYAVLAEYNKSIICFENTLKIQPDFQAAAKRKHAVKCHAKLESALEAQHRSLQRTLSELREYQESHEYWRQQQEKLMNEQVSGDLRLEQRKAYEVLQQRKSDAGLSEVCLMEEVSGQNVLQCSTVESNPLLIDEEFLSSWDNRNKIPPPSRSNTRNYMTPVRPAIFTRRMSTSGKVNRHPSPHQEIDWPTKEECDNLVHKFPAWNEFPTNYLPPENKGFEVRALLTEAQGLSLGQQHSFPWYPPVCVDLPKIPEGPEAYDHIQSVKERSKVPSKIPDTSVRDILIHLVDNPRDERVEIVEEGQRKSQVTQDEIGQRILTALKQNIGPSWVLYNLAALYWRIQGNHYHGLECIRRAIFFCPEDYKDVPLLNLANILYKLGRVDDAVMVTRDALAINDFEPETHFFLGNLLAAKANLTGAINHYHEALAQYPQHKSALTSLRIVKCYLKHHHSAQSLAPRTDRDEAASGSCKPCSSTSQQQQPQKQCCKAEKKSNCANENKSEGASRGGCTMGDTDAVYQMHCSLPTPKADFPCPTESGLFAIDHGCKRSDDDGSATFEHCIGTPFSAQALSDALDPMNVDMPTQLEMSEFLRPRALLCSGEECQKLLLQNHRLHTRLEVVNGMLHQKLIFVDSASDLVVSPNDCVIFNDGQRSPGCDREEFKPFNLDEINITLNLSPFSSSVENAAYDHKDSVSSGNAQDPSTSDSPESCVWRQGHLTRRSHAPTIAYSHYDIVKKSPDPVRHIRKTAGIPAPSPEECKNSLRHINFQIFMSTWVSVTAKGINIADVIDFTTPQPNHLGEPHCADTEEETALDLLPSIQDIDAATAQYMAEIGLKDPLQKLGGEDHILAVPVAGTKIADALKLNPTSWVLANLAALYWRVEGEGPKAVKCLKLAYKNAPDDSKDVALLALANILYKSGHVDDALIVTDMALEAAPHLVVLHFTMANLYASKGEWDRAVKFYDAVLALQESFTPALHRLNAIRCNQVKH